MQIVADKKKPQIPPNADQPVVTDPYFFVNVEYSLVKISIAHINYIEGMKDYVKIFLDNENRPVITKATLKSIESKLPGDAFMRVHKSYIVDVNKIQSI